MHKETSFCSLHVCTSIITLYDSAFNIYGSFSLEIRYRLMAKKKSWENLPSLILDVSEEGVMLEVPSGRFDRIPP